MFSIWTSLNFVVLVKSKGPPTSLVMLGALTTNAMDNDLTEVLPKVIKSKL